jgi:hypothetical protein
MFNKLARLALLGGATLSLALLLNAGTAMAGGTTCTDDFDCDGIPDSKDNCPKDPTNTCKKVDGICHNIGGPDGKGANCDWDAASCTAIDLLDTSTSAELLFLFLKYSEAVANCGTGCDPDNIYAGIFVPHSDNAIEAHRAHGDGEILVRWDKKSDDPSDVTPSSRVHEPQPHVAANVDCFAERVIFPPEDQGN